MDGKIVSAVLLKKSGAKGPGIGQYLFNGGLALAAQLGIKRIFHILKTLDTMKEACKRYGRESWYIDSFAVAKGFQGKSLGSTLFNAFLFPYIREHGGGRIMLVTHTELNKKFYCKKGLRFLTNLALVQRAIQSLIIVSRRL
ncbi:GNAT family N-acetyltransferase [Paenibacillus sp. FSL R7-0345]|uniref:GNAT family N-acetyltransferase n=1 Tax=Paenibacillus sp. FSL R7-0345 TaxID=2954535 RepID=UPI00315A2A29